MNLQVKNENKSRKKSRVRPIFDFDTNKKDKATQMRRYRACNPDYINEERLRRKIRCRKKKERIVKILGGKCKRCEYSRNIASLELHHPDGRIERDIGRSYLGWSWERIEREVIPFVELFYANCHREIENPELAI